MMKKRKIDKKLKKVIRIASVTSFFILTYCNYSAAAGMGDINSDNKITIEDSNLLKTYLIRQIEFTNEQKTYADINGDGKITITDLSLLKAKNADDEEKKLRSLEIASLPNKVKYFEGEGFDASGLVVMANYSNGEQEDVTSNVTLSKFDSSKIGSQVITVTYKGKTTSFSVTITTKLNLVTINRVTGIRITSLPDKIAYKYGESLDLTGLKVVKRWSNGQTQAINDYVVSGYNPYEEGIQTLTVTYTGLDEDNNYKTYRTTFTISVVDYVEKVDVTPIKTNLKYGEQLEFVAIAKYVSGKEIDIIKEVIIEGYNPNADGNQTVTYKYSKKVLGETKEFIGEFNVYVWDYVQMLEITSPVQKTEYVIGESFDSTGLVLTAIYASGTKADVTEECSINGFESNSEGDKLIRCDYEQSIDAIPEKIVVYTSFTVTVKAEEIEKSLTGISVKTKPNKTVYYIGDTTIDLTGAELELQYNDNSTETKEITEDMISGFDTISSGLKTITVEFEGYTATFDIEVNDYINELDVLPTKENLKYGEDLEFVAIATYASGLEKDITSEITLEGYDPTKVGIQTVSYGYSENLPEKIKVFAGEFKVTVWNYVVDLEITSLPQKTEYLTGENLDTAGLVINAIYASGDKKDVTSEVTIEGYDANKVGIQTVTYKYVENLLGETNEFSGIFDITVKEKEIEKSLTGISVKTKPNKTVYYIGDTTIDLTGAELELQYNDNSTETKEITENMVSGFDTSTIGFKTITVSYEGCTTAFDIEVLDYIEELTVTPEKTNLKYGEEIKITAIALYASGNEVDITSEVKVDNYDANKLGIQEVTYSYTDGPFNEGMMGFVGQFKVTVIDYVRMLEITNLPDKVEYIIGESFDPTGLVLTAIYASGAEKDVTSESNINGFESNSAGEKTISCVYYQQITALLETFVADANFTVTVKEENVEKSLTGVSVKTKPNKTVYYIGDATIDLTGAELELQYDDNSTEIKEITENMTSGFDTSTIGFKEITVSYEGYTATFNIEIIENNVTSIEMISNPTQTTYVQYSGELDVSGGKILVTYADGSTKEIEITEDMVSGFDNSILGNIEVTVTYEGTTTTFSVEIVERTATKVEIVSLPDKLEYTTNDQEIDLTGGIIRVTYNDGTTANYLMTAAEVSGFDNTFIGTQTITIKYMNVYTTFTITVEQGFSAYLDKNNLVLDYGTNGLLTLTINIPAGESASVQYGTANSNVATLDAPVKYDGYMEFSVIPTGRGTTTLTFKVTYNEEVINLSCEVTVNKDVTPVESVSLDKTSITVSVGDTFTLTPTINPTDADDITNLGWSWTCTEENSIECTDANNGVFVVNGNGSAVIEFIVTTETGEFRAQCEVTILDENAEIPIALSSIEEISPFSKLSTLGEGIVIK